MLDKISAIKQITVLRHTQYKGCPIYIMQFDTVFQYLFVYNNEIYQYHIFFRPNPLRYILYLLGLYKLEYTDSKGLIKVSNHPYTKDQLDEGESVILNGAMRSIDQLLENAKSIRTMSKRGRKDKDETSQ